MEHIFSSIIHNLGGMLNNWSELEGLSAQRSFACSWWICGIQCTLRGERGNIVLSCVSVFTAHSLINYSAGALWLWPAVLRTRPGSPPPKTGPWQHLLLLMYLLSYIVSRRHAGTLVLFSCDGRRVKYYSNCHSSGQMRRGGEAVYEMSSVVTSGNSHLFFFSFLSPNLEGEVKRRRVFLLHSWGVPRLSVSLSHRPFSWVLDLFNQRQKAASQPTCLINTKGKNTAVLQTPS